MATPQAVDIQGILIGQYPQVGVVTMSFGGDSKAVEPAFARQIAEVFDGDGRTKAIRDNTFEVSRDDAGDGSVAFGSGRPFRAHRARLLSRYVTRGFAQCLRDMADAVEEAKS